MPTAQSTTASEWEWLARCGFNRSHAKGERQFRAAIARHDPRPDEVFQRLACCPSLEVGDTVFYREDVVHGTQDSLVDRLGMSITLESTDPPPLAPRSASGPAGGGEGGVSSSAQGGAFALADLRAAGYTAADARAPEVLSISLETFARTESSGGGSSAATAWVQKLRAAG